MASHPIFAAAFHGDVSKVRRLVTEDPTAIGIRNAVNLTPLHVAASRGQADVIDELIAAGADASGPSDSDEWTPLVWASYRGHLAAVESLIVHGADTGSTGGNPIHFAGQRKHKDVCRALVEAGAVDELLPRKNRDKLALIRAAYSYDHATVDAILTENPKLAAMTDRNGRTLLHEVCTHGDTRTARVLLKHGCPTDVRDRQRQTPLDRATSHNQRAIVKLLEKHNSPKSR